MSTRPTVPLSASSIQSAPAPEVAPSAAIPAPPPQPAARPAPANETTVSTERPEAGRRRPTVVAAGAAAVIALVAGGWFVFGRSDESAGGSNAALPKAVTHEPTRVSRSEVDGSAAVVGRIGDRAYFSTYENSGDENVVAVTVSTGDVEWTEDADAAAIFGSEVLIASGTELQRYSADGRAEGQSIDLDISSDDSVSSLVASGNAIVVRTDYGESFLVNPSSWTVVASGITTIGSDGATAATIDYRASSLRVALVDTASGNKVGERYTVDGYVTDQVLAAGGRLVVIADDQLQLLDTMGEVLQSADLPYGTEGFSGIVGDYVMVSGTDSRTVYRVTPSGIAEIDDTDGSYLFAEGGSPYIVAWGDGQVDLEQVKGDALSFLWDASGDSVYPATGGAYIRDSSEVSYYALPGDGRPVWSYRVDDSVSSVQYLDGLIVVTTYDYDTDRCEIELLG